MKPALWLFAAAIPFAAIGCAKDANTADMKSTDMKSTDMKSTDMKMPAEHPAYSSRGLVKSVVQSMQSKPASITVDEEDIPKFMEAMEMDYTLLNPEDAATLKPGDKVSFDLYKVAGKGLLAANIKKLPPETQLKLAP